MWQSTISLRYVSYKNADSNLHKRICALAMMAKNLLWSCAPIVAPRPPINPQRPNHTMQRMRASRLGQSQFERPRRLARPADGGRWVATHHMKRILLFSVLAALLGGCSKQSGLSLS